ncbi:MAG: class I SAM-dependent methyltransferase [Bacteroidia bacterium]|nr:class I SAM-dependent methyltransferase [Bacteroidia bacterium]
MESIDNCPVCNSTVVKNFLTCIDYTVSNERFNIVQCDVCKFKFTNPRPIPNELFMYYKSEKYVSHSDTKKGLVNKLYHIVRKYALIKKLQLVVRLSHHAAQMQKSILDIGCGTGAFLAICNKAHFRCVGVEPDIDARNIAINKYKLDVMEEHDLTNLPPSSFDIITLWHVLEHVSNLNGRIIQLKNLVKPNGRIVVAVPNCSSFDAKYYKEYWAGYDVPRHLYHFTPKDIISIFRNHGMEVENIYPMRFDSYYVSMLSEKYKSSTLGFFKSLLVGLISNVAAIRTGREFSSQIYVIKKRNGSST